METQYLLVDKSALPEVFEKVVKAKQLLVSGVAQNSSEAARLAGISRSSFYKYKDMVHPYNASSSGFIITIHAMLVDSPGVLSRLTNEFYKAGANILTVNQNIPVRGVAPVSISARIDSMTISVDQLLSLLRKLDGVRDIFVVSGN